MNEKNSVQNRGTAADNFRAALSKAEKVVDATPIINYHYSSMKTNGDGKYDVSINSNGQKTQLSGVSYNDAQNAITSHNTGSWTGDYWWPTDPWNPWRRGIDTTPWVPKVIEPIRVPVIWEDYPKWKKSELQKFIEDIHKLAKDVPNKLPSNVVSGSWPASNLFLTENKDLVIQCALAGYAEDEFTVEHENEHITIKINKPELKFKSQKEVEDLPEEDRPITIKSYLQRGIKFGDGEIKFYVDPKLYNAERATMEFKNGLLTIIIPKDEKVDKKTVLRITSK